MAPEEKPPEEKPSSTSNIPLPKENMEKPSITSPQSHPVRRGESFHTEESFLEIRRRLKRIYTPDNALKPPDDSQLTSLIQIRDFPELNLWLAKEKKSEKDVVNLSALSIFVM